MKKLVYLILFAVFIVCAGIILNLNVTTQQCIDYECHTISMPLYLKILDFFNRHYHYKQLVKNIVKDVATDEERVIKMFNWTYKNIKKAPAGLPVVDDHVWYTIVRGYAVNDQFSDVFTTLCNYAGIDAFYDWAYTQDKSGRISLSFIKINGKWYIFDPYRGAYFKDRAGNFATLEILKLGDGYIIEYLDKQTTIDIDYGRYLTNLASLKEIGLVRPKIQSPLNRFLFEIKKHLN